MKRILTVAPHTLIAAIAFYTVAVLNGPFWDRFLQATTASGNPPALTIVAAGIVLFVLVTALLSLFATPYLLKPLAILSLLLSAATAYFLNEYGTEIDSNMVRNVLQTEWDEASDLIGPRFLISVAIWGGIPAVLIGLSTISWKPWRLNVLGNARVVLAASACAVAIVTALPQMRELASGHKDLRYRLVPYNVVAATTRFLRSKEPWLPQTVSVFAADAHRAAASQRESRPLVTVLVVGETARAANFSLLGYERLTNPRLADVAGLISFKHVASCGTDTAHSVPCMFSGLGRRHFTNWKAAKQENLLDVARRAGLSVRWRDNQSGCKGVCRRTPTEELARAGDKRFCSSKGCFDEILLDKLEEQIMAMKSGGIVTLHMIGSHGPSYYMRVPPQFRTFQPTCDTRDIRTCSIASLVNTYDNTIVYSDFVLSKLIAMLDKMSTHSIDTSMIYVSDHGESLGEAGKYLHGSPYGIAPAEQTHVPMLMWIAPKTRSRLAIDQQCLTKAAEQKEFSHDNIFHTVLGIHDIQTSVYDAALDITAACRHLSRHPT